MGAEHFELTGIAIIVAAAVLLGGLFSRLKQPAIVGYILAGVVLGPTGFGLIESSDSIRFLAELGVLLLLFIVGTELSLKAFIAVVGPASMVAGGQIAAALCISVLFGVMLGWPVEQILVLAFIVALSSTAVAIGMLDDIDELRTPTGQISIGVLIAQDIAIVPMLIIINSLGSGGGFGFLDLIKIVAAVGFLLALIRYLSRRKKIRLPGTTAIAGRVDLIALSALAGCFCAAALSGLLGLSPAYGAFVAGLVVSSSTIRAEAIRVSEPIQSVLVVMFFLSIGLLIDLSFIAANALLVFSFVIGVIAVKTAFNIFLMRAARRPWEQAFPAALVMAQIGEFSFVIAGAGLSNGALDVEAYKLAIAVIAISLLVSPIWMTSIRRFHLIASEGVTDFKTALAEIYQDELTELEEGSANIAKFTKHFIWRMRALRRVARAKRKASDRSG
jgi:CPA2 family monovalent cation:H+ antiporter-2